MRLAANSVLEAFKELPTFHPVKALAQLHKTLMSTNSFESMFPLVRQNERKIKCTRGSARLQHWLGPVLLYCENQFNRVNGFAEDAQVMKTIEESEQQSPSTTKVAKNNHGRGSGFFKELIDNLSLGRQILRQNGKPRRSSVDNAELQTRVYILSSSLRWVTIQV